MMERKPNILFVFSDEHRWCDMGCYGNQTVKTPNLDKFARDGVVFDHCISNTPVCVPARGLLMTGVYPLNHGAVTNDLPIKNDIESIASVMNDNEYHTGYIGKWHLAGIPRDQAVIKEKRLGFTEWKVSNCCHSYMDSYYYDENNHFVKIDGYEPIEQTNLALDFIKRNSDKPWGLVLSWAPPHEPYRHIPKENLDEYEGIEITLRDNVPEQIQQPKQNKEAKYATKDEIIKDHQAYYANITELDRQFGRLINHLEETNQLENTIVVYTSDHGTMLGSQGVINKQWHYDESIRVPFIISWKGKTLQCKRHDLFGLIDLPVSLLGLAGMNFSGEIDGTDLHKLFIDKDAKGIEACYILDLIPCHQSANRNGTEWRGIRTKQYTFARTASDEGFALYDNDKDPYQMTNVLNQKEYKLVKQKLMKQLDEFVSKHDKLLPWEDFIREFGLKEEWNQSQEYFQLPLLV